jgi:hypothetical protein
VRVDAWEAHAMKTTTIVARHGKSAPRRPKGPSPVERRQDDERWRNTMLLLWRRTIPPEEGPDSQRLDTGPPPVV